MTRSQAQHRSPTWTLLILSVSALAYALAQTTVVPAIPDLMRGLHTHESGVTWTLTGYLIAAAVPPPVVGRLGDIYGKRRMLVVALVAFAAGSVVAALSSRLWLVLTGRVVQGGGVWLFLRCGG